MTMTHGGKRDNEVLRSSEEASKPRCIPLSHVHEVKPFLNNELNFSLPLYGSSVQAGFPSPADDYIEAHLDLNSHLVKHPAATFFVKARGDSMIDAGITSGDMLVVDRSIDPIHGKIVIAALNGELTVKRLSRQAGKLQLLSENKRYKPIDITEEEELVIWGVVTHVIHSTE